MTGAQNSAYLITNPTSESGTLELCLAEARMR